ncbi:MAG: hypothetical protein PHQ75_09470, partial [Thermoguttaceae bacterium]|nr:hypothetical protein [Thermoguttaceae bacterium]
GNILRDGYKKAQEEAEELRQKMFSAYQNTVKMVLENDKFKAHAAKAVNANSIEALTLQSRSFDAIPKIAAPTMTRDQNLNVAQNALTVSTNTAATALQSFATQLAALHMNYPGLGGVSAAVTVSPQKQIAKTSTTASTGSGQQSPVPVTIQQPKGGAMDGMTVDLSKLETSAGDINAGILSAVKELKSAVQSLQQIKGTVSGLSIVSY